MPKYFHWRAPDRNWDAPLESHRCLYVKDNGHQCKRHCIVGIPFCYAHLLHQQHLYVAPSTLRGAGNGLFSAATFEKGATVVHYDGKRLTSDQLQHLYGDYTAPYAIALDKHKAIDAALVRGAGALVNHNPRAANVEFKLRKRQNRVVGVDLVAKKHILSGQELFVSYGRQYRMKEAGVRSWTDQCKKGC